MDFFFCVCEDSNRIEIKCELFLKYNGFYLLLVKYVMPKFMDLMKNSSRIKRINIFLCVFLIDFIKLSYYIYIYIYIFENNSFLFGFILF